MHSSSFQPRAIFAGAVWHFIDHMPFRSQIRHIKLLHIPFIRFGRFARLFRLYKRRRGILGSYRRLSVGIFVCFRFCRSFRQKKRKPFSPYNRRFVRLTLLLYYGFPLVIPQYQHFFLTSPVNRSGSLHIL